MTHPQTFEPVEASGEHCPERGKHDKEGRQRALLEAATVVFARHGFDAATTRQVAEQAGCSEGLIHRYFGGKRGLLLAALHQRANGVAEDFAQKSRPRETVEAELNEILRTLTDYMWESRDSMRVTISQSAIDDEVGRTIGHHFNDVRVAFVAGRLEAHRAAGRIRDDADLDAIAHTIAGCGFALGFMARVVFEVDRADVERRAAEFAHCLALGLAAGVRS